MNQQNLDNRNPEGIQGGVPQGQVAPGKPKFGLNLLTEQQKAARIQVFMSMEAAGDIQRDTPDQFTVPVVDHFGNTIHKTYYIQHFKDASGDMVLLFRDGEATLFDVNGMFCLKKGEGYEVYDTGGRKIDKDLGALHKEAVDRALAEQGVEPAEAPVPDAGEERHIPESDTIAPDAAPEAADAPAETPAPAGDDVQVHISTDEATGKTIATKKTEQGWISCYVDPNNTAVELSPWFATETGEPVDAAAWEAYIVDEKAKNAPAPDPEVPPTPKTPVETPPAPVVPPTATTPPADAPAPTETPAPETPPADVPTGDPAAENAGEEVTEVEGQTIKTMKRPDGTRVSVIVDPNDHSVALSPEFYADTGEFLDKAAGEKWQADQAGDGEAPADAPEEAPPAPQTPDTGGEATPQAFLDAGLTAEQYAKVHADVLNTGRTIGSVAKDNKRDEWNKYAQGVGIVNPEALSSAKTVVSTIRDTLGIDTE